MAKRGSAVSVPESWLEQCRLWRQEQGLTMEATGARLARAVKRGRPFADATVRRYLRGRLVTDELTRAFAKVMGVSTPVTIDDENYQEWYELGVRLNSAKPTLFEAELARLRQIADMAEALQDPESKPKPK